MGKSFPPLTVLQSFDLTPVDTHVALLLRHAHRDSIKTGTYGDEIALTTAGVHAARELGRVLGWRQVGRLLTSPVARCVHTAVELAIGAGWQATIVEDWCLGKPGPFVVDPSIAGPLFPELGTAEVAQRQLADAEPLPGMRPTLEGVSLVIDLMLKNHSRENVLDVFITHDAILAVTIGHLLDIPMDKTNWPSFLEGLFVWQLPRGLGVAWQGTSQEIRWPRWSET